MQNNIEPSNKGITYKGQCLCGEIQYKVSRIEPNMAHCHCSMCRKFHGAAFATFGEAKIENFHWINGEDQLKSYHAENGTKRKFCRHCGSSMIFVPAKDDGKVIEFTLATLDDDINGRPDAHIFVGSKANWDNICDVLPQYNKDRT